MVSCGETQTVMTNLPRKNSNQAGNTGSLGRNDPCPCGSGLKFKKCHSRVKEEYDAGPSRYRDASLRQLVLEEIRTFKEIFEVRLDEETLAVKEKINDSDVQFFFERVHNLWNSSPPLVDRMPRADDLRYRALYFGTPDMFRTVNMIARYSLYCDQIIVIDPFGWFREHRRDAKHAVVREPQAWVRQIVRDGVYLCSLEDWIKSGLVEVTAFPLRIADPIRLQHIRTMESKLEQMPNDRRDAMIAELADDLFADATPEELETLRPPHADGLGQLRESLEDSEVLDLLQQQMPGVTRGKLLTTLQHVEERNKQIDRIRDALKKEPRRYKWAQGRQFEDRMTVSGAGMNLEDAKWLADITGAHLVTDRHTLWDEILADSAAGGDASPEMTHALTSLAEGFQRLKFTFLNDVPLGFALKIRQEGKLEGFRSFIRNFWNKARAKGTSETERLGAIKEFQEGLAAEYQSYKREFAEIEKSVYSKVAFAGISGAGALISGSLQLGLLSLGLFAAAYGKELQRQTKKGNPLSIFLGLERSSPSSEAPQCATPT
jgi:SEC-C motif